MSLHLVELDADDEIIDEVEVDEDILEAIESIDESQELSLSDENNSLYIVELDDAGNIIDAEVIEGGNEDQELSLGLLSAVKTGANIIRAGVRRGGVNLKRAIGPTGIARARSIIPSLRKDAGTIGAGIKSGASSAMSGIKSGASAGFGRVKSAVMGSSRRTKAIVGTGVGAAGLTAMTPRRQRQEYSLSLSNEEQRSAKHNPLIADAELRIPQYAE